MKFKLTSTAAVVMAAFSCSWVAPTQAEPYANVYVAEMHVETIREIAQSSGTSQTRYEVDGMDIEITKADEVKARNWNLTPAEWAQYKYAMEYTPRGLWSPELDPPIVLGLLSKTEREKSHFAKLMNAMEIDRREREVDLQKYGIKDIKERMGTATLVQSTQFSPMETRLGEHKTSIKSIFVSTDLSRCDTSCTKFLLKTIASTPSSQTVAIYYNEGTEADVYALFRKSGFTIEDLAKRNAQIVKSPEKFAKYVHGVDELPFYIKISDKGETRKGVTRTGENKK
jgi:integrating conjugative element protein (TIGR03759 family)